MPFIFFLVATSSAAARWLWYSEERLMAILAGLWAVSMLGMSLYLWTKEPHTDKNYRPVAGLIFSPIALILLLLYLTLPEIHYSLLIASFIIGFTGLGSLLEYLRLKIHLQPAPSRIIKILTSTAAIALLCVIALCAPFIIALATSVLVALLPMIALITVIIASLLVIRAVI